MTILWDQPSLEPGEIPYLIWRMTYLSIRIYLSMLGNTSIRFPG